VTKDLALQNLLTTNNIDVAVITEAELPSTTAPYSIHGYTSFFPTVSPGDKTRVLALVKSDLATTTGAKIRKDLMSERGLSVWFELDTLLVGGIYRQWSGPCEEADLEMLINQCKRATTSHKKTVVMGDLNLDLHRHGDRSYSRRAKLARWLNGMEEAGLEHQETRPTWSSHGSFSGCGGDGRRHACLDHVYTSAGVALPPISVLDDATTDHRPVMALVDQVTPRSSLRSMHNCST